ncbi:MAG TPA: DUF547 domain-containing protein [Coleofasciculaceae cyanobacterium]|jgi:hypothetical protein
MKLHEFLFWTALFLISAVFLVAQPMNARAGKVLNDGLATKPFGHHIWQEIITQNLGATGEMNLINLRAHPERLNQYLGQLKAVSPESHPDYFPTADDRLAYWINAHNALALRLILNRYPAETLADEQVFQNETRYHMGQRPVSLAWIKQKVAEAHPRYPMVVLTLTDYTLSSPPLNSQAYQGATLRKQVAVFAQNTLQEGRLIQFDRSRTDCIGIKLSPIFRHYGLAPEAGEAEDQDRMADPFEADSPSPAKTWADIIQPFAPPDIAANLGHQCTHSVEFLPPTTNLRQVQAL